MMGYPAEFAGTWSVEREGGVGVDVRRLRWMCGASASVQGSGGSASAVSGRECRRCATDVFEWVVAHPLLPSSLPLLRLGLPRRPQRRAGWARGEGGGGARVYHSPGLKVV